MSKFEILATILCVIATILFVVTILCVVGLSAEQKTTQRMVGIIEHNHGKVDEYSPYKLTHFGVEK